MSFSLANIATAGVTNPSTNQPARGASITINNAGTTTAATLYAIPGDGSEIPLTGTPISQPILSDDDGNVDFAAAPGVYDLYYLGTKFATVSVAPDSRDPNWSGSGSAVPKPSASGEFLQSTGTSAGDFGWAAPPGGFVPTPPGSGDVLTSTGPAAGNYSWQAPTGGGGGGASLPTPGASGEVLTATGSGAGDYTWREPVGTGSLIDVAAENNITTPSSTTDYASVINAALTAASAAGGGEVYLRAGTWGIASRLQVPSNVTLRGAGKGTTTLNAIFGGNGNLMSTDAAGGYSVICGAGSAQSANNVKLVDFTLMCNGANSNVPGGGTAHGSSSMIDFRYSDHLSLDGVQVIQGWMYHFGFYVCTNVDVRRCEAWPATTGKFNQLDGIHFWECQKVKCIGNTVDQTYGGGTAWQDGDDAIAVHVFSSTGVCRDITIADNVLQPGYDGGGIDLANGGTSTMLIEDVTITGNILHDKLVNPQYSVITTQWFGGTGATSGTTRGITIVGNVIRDCGSIPIWVGGGNWGNAPCENVLVAANQADNPGGGTLTQCAGGLGGTNDVNVQVYGNNPGATVGGGASLTSYLTSDLVTSPTIPATADQTVIATVDASDSPPMPSVTVVGTSGGWQFGYAIAWQDANGNSTPPSGYQVILNGPAGASSTNYNTISWPTPPAWVANVAIYGRYPNYPMGLLATVPASTTSWNDQGTATVGAAAKPTYVVNLPDATTCKDSVIRVAKESNESWSVTIAPQSGQTIAGRNAPAMLASQGSTWGLVSDGSATWRIIEQPYGVLHSVTPEQFGAHGDNATDDSAAIQNAIAAAVAACMQDSSWVAEVVFAAEKTYLVSGALQTNPTINGMPSGAYGQICFPMIPNASQTNCGPTVMLTLRSSQIAPMAAYQNLDQQNYTTGATVRTTLTSPSGYQSAGWPAVFSGPMGTGWTMIHLAVDGINIVQPSNPTLVGWQCSFFNRISFGTIRVYTQPLAYEGSSSLPTNTSGIGMITPRTYNGALMELRNAEFMGLYAGMIMYEHMHVGHLETNLCMVGIVPENSASPDTWNASLIEHWHMINCPYGLANISNPVTTLGAAQYMPIVVNLWDIEYQASGTWETIYHIFDTNNVLSMYARYNNINASNATAPVPALLLSGAAKCNVQDLTQAAGASSSTPAIPASGTNVTNPFGRDCLVYVTGALTSPYIEVNGVTVGGAGAAGTVQSVMVPAHQSIQLNYSTAPTWVWQLLS